MPKDGWKHNTKRRQRLSEWERTGQTQDLVAKEMVGVHTAAELEVRLRRKPRRRRSVAGTQRKTRLNGLRQHESQTQTLPSGRRRVGRSIWFLPPPYTFDKHPVPTPEEMQAMFGTTR